MARLDPGSLFLCGLCADHVSSEQRKRERARVKNTKELPCRRLQIGTARNSSGLKGARNNVQSMYSIGKQKKKRVERCHMQRGRKVPLERNVACDMNPIVFPHQNSSGSSKVLKKTTRLARGAVELYRGAKHRRVAMLGITGGSDWCWTQTGVGPRLVLDQPHS